MQFEFLNFGSEREHLKQQTETEKTELHTKINELIEKDCNISAYAIAKALPHDESKFNSFKVKVSRIVNKIRKNSNDSNK